MDFHDIPEEDPQFLAKYVRSALMRGMYNVNITPWVELFNKSKIHIVDGSNLGNSILFINVKNLFRKF